MAECGATTKNGSRCRARVAKAGVRCWRHAASSKTDGRMCLKDSLQTIDAAANFDALCSRHFPSAKQAYFKNGKICCDPHADSKAEKLRREMKIMAELIRRNKDLEGVRERLKEARTPRGTSGGWRERLGNLGHWVIDIVKQLAEAITTSVRVFSRHHPRAFFLFLACVMIYYMAPIGASQAVVSVGHELVALVERALGVVQQHDWHTVAVDFATRAMKLINSGAAANTAVKVAKSAKKTELLKGAASKGVAAGVSAVSMGAGLVAGAVVAPVALPVLQMVAGEFDFVEWVLS